MGLLTVSTLNSQNAAYHHGDLHAALVQAGLAILDETGDANALSLREAARRAGVSAMAPYRHFSDKDALLAAIATVGFERLRDTLIAVDRDALNQDDGAPVRAALQEASQEVSQEALVAQGVAYVAFACARPALFRLMFAAGRCARPEPLKAASRASYAIMVERVASLVAPDAAQERALQCWATAHGIATLAIDGQLDAAGVPATALADRLLRLTGIPFEAKMTPSENPA